MSVVCTSVFVLIIMCIHEFLFNVIIILFKNKNMMQCLHVQESYKN